MLIMLSACNRPAPQDRSERQKSNEQFVEEISKNSEYKELRFLNEDRPVYYKVIASAPETEEPLYPFQNSQVRATLSGRLISGQVFQSEETMNLEMNNIVKGLQIALQKMNVGDTWEVVVPWEYGYGRYTYRNLIPGFSTLIFTVKLEEIIKR